ncbi:hypothetical protein TNCV_704811 [Trichonephila clavipes]|nr:hypothetical protein TNCV_704811 [Trichonephila clavipes]
MASVQEQAQVIASFTKFKYSTQEDPKCDSTTLEFKGDRKFTGRRMEKESSIQRLAVFLETTNSSDA